MAMLSVKVQGLDDLLKNIRKARKQVPRKVQVGLIKAGVFLLRESQKLVPVQFGVLKGSGFVRTRDDLAPQEIKPVQVGYTASYAIFVHENLEAAHGRAYNEKHLLKILPGVDATGKKVSKRKHTVKSGNFFRGVNQQAKFLESPFRWYRDFLELAIVSEARKAIKQAGLEGVVSVDIRGGQA